MRRSILVAVTLAALTTSVFALGAQAPAEMPTAGVVQGGDDAMTDVDPDLLLRCKREAAQKKLVGPARATFMNACVEPED